MKKPIGIYKLINHKKERGQKQIAVLVDPDKIETPQIADLIKLAEQAQVDYFFIGGSLLFKDQLEACVKAIKAQTNIPTVLFPGSVLQICPSADAILFLSLISGRNPELLIGQHVIAAPYLKASQLEVIPTGYMLIDGGQPTTASYMSNTLPIPADKPDVAACTAMAGAFLGLKIIYLDGGSGAQNPIATAMIKLVSESVDLPIIVGGGIRSSEQAYKSASAGADLIVVGNILEKDPRKILEISSAVKAAAGRKVKSN